MPRTGRGGKRQGTPGQAYANRTDLQTGQPVAVQSSPGQIYGDRTSQEAGQKVVPVAAAPTAPGPAPSPSPAAPTPAPAAAPQAGNPTPGMPPHLPVAGSLPFTGPSERPTEPVTAGLARGAGPGPEALRGVGAIANNIAPSDSTVALLASLANSPTAGAALHDLAGMALDNRQ